MHDTPVIRLPAARPCPFTPPVAYAALPPGRPPIRAALADGGEAWLITGWSDARAVLSDPRFSSDRLNPSFPRMMRAAAESTGGMLVSAALPTDHVTHEAAAASAMPSPTAMRGRVARAMSLISMDPPRHTTARRAVISEFTFRRVQALRPSIERIVATHVDAMLAAGPPADLVQALALPVPSQVICELLGVPYSDHEFFQQRTALMLSRRAEPRQRRFASRELRGYLAELVSAKARHPTDDLLGRQIARQRVRGDDVHDDLVNLAFLLLIAGHETTANMIALGALALLRRPDLFAAIRDDPGGVPLAVEEMLRFFSIADAQTARVAVADVEVGGTLIRAGDGVVVSLFAANRDPAAFPDPDTLDPRRDARRHIAFGFGPHQCLGQSLARVELEVVYGALLHRLPQLRLAAAPAAVPVKDDAFVYGLYELPVAW